MHTVPATCSINITLPKPVKLFYSVYTGDATVHQDGPITVYPTAVTGFTVAVIRDSIYDVAMHYTGDALIDPDSDYIDAIAHQINVMLAAFGVDVHGCTINMAQAAHQDEMVNGAGRLVFDAPLGGQPDAFLTQLMAIPNATVKVKVYDALTGGFV